MKRFLLLFCTMFIGTSFATTVNIDWISNGNTYDQTTCQTGGNFTLPAQNPTKYGYTFVGWHFDEITGTGSQNGTPTPTNPIYPTFMPLGNTFLRAVDTVADTYDPTTGLITRRVGVKVLDGTENWSWQTYLADYFTTTLPNQYDAEVYYRQVYCNMFESVSYNENNTCRIQYKKFSIRYDNANGDVNTFKQWLADQYNAGTPVTVYYPLATPTTEALQ